MGRHVGDMLEKDFRNILEKFDFSFQKKALKIEMANDLIAGFQALRTDSNRFIDLLGAGQFIQSFITRASARVLAAIQPHYRSVLETYPWVHDQPIFILRGPFQKPCDIVSLGDELYILTDDTSISVYRGDVCIRSITDHTLRYTQMIMDESHNELIVYEHTSRFICFLDPITFCVRRKLRFFGSNDHCGGMAIAGDYLYVSYIATHQIGIFHRVSGQLIHKWGLRGVYAGEFNRPLGIRIRDKQLFVCDSGNKRMQVFALDGRFIDTWNTNFFVDPFNEFPSPNTLDFCKNGDVLIVDCFGIRRYTSSGVFVRIVIDFISNFYPDPDMFKYGIGDRYVYTISVMENGTIAVCDRFSSRVMLLDDYTEMKATDAAF